MHWLVIKAQPVYVSYNLKYQCEVDAQTSQGGLMFHWPELQKS